MLSTDCSSQALLIMYLHLEIYFFYLVSYQNKSCQLNTSKKDRERSRVRRLIQSEDKISDTETELRPYTQKASKLSVVDSTLLCGSRVIIPHSRRNIILQQLHETHQECQR